MNPAESERDESTTLERLVTFILAGGVLLALTGVVYVSLTPVGSADPFTEFYVLGPNGTAGNYPADLAVGETATVTVGVANHETSETRYTVLVLVDAERTARRSLTLDRGETWERDVSVTPTRTGTQRVRLLLYEGAGASPSDAQQSLRLWINASRPT